MALGLAAQGAVRVVPARAHSTTRHAAVKPAPPLAARAAAFQRPNAIAIRPRGSTGRALAMSVRAESEMDLEPFPTSVPKEVLDTVVVGAGLSGMCVGQVLKKKGVAQTFLVTESKALIGGNISTVKNDEGFMWENGPNSFQPGDPMLRMTTDVGQVDNLALADPEAPRFVWWDKKLRPTPDGLASLPTFTLLSPLGKIRAGLGAVGIKPAMPDYEESVEQFIRRNLGAEVFERLIEPFCSGVYAGDPSKLGMKAAFGRIHVLEEMGGSLVGGAIKLIQDRKKNPVERDADLPPKPAGQTVASYQQGLKTLPEAIAKQIHDKVRVSWVLKGISKCEEGYELTYDTPDGVAKVKAKSVVMTAPAYVVSELLKDEVPAASKALGEIYYPPVGAVTVGFPESALKPDAPPLKTGKFNGFGQLHPRSQGITTLGTIYSSSLFPNRAPPGWVTILNYIGGAQNTSILDMTDDELVAQVDKDIRTMLIKDDAPPAKKLGVKVWPNAIPQFNIGHLDLLETARTSMDAAGYDKVVLAGNYVAGVAIGKCVDGAYTTADTLDSVLNKK